jgi:Tfp pilus assembly protein PilN
MPLQVEEQRLKEIERQIALRKDEVRAVEKLKKEIEDITRETALVDNFRKEKPLYMDIAREITQIIPKNAWLTRVRIAGNLVNLEGYSPSASGLIEVLEASKFFQKVEFASPTFRDARLNTDRFQIKMELEGVIPEKQTNEKK